MRSLMENTPNNPSEIDMDWYVQSLMGEIPEDDPAAGYHLLTDALAEFSRFAGSPRYELCRQALEGLHLFFQGVLLLQMNNVAGAAEPLRKAAEQLADAGV